MLGRTDRGTLWRVVTALLTGTTPTLIVATARGRATNCGYRRRATGDGRRTEGSRVMRTYLPIAAIAFVACSKESPVAPAGPVEPSYSFAISGDRSDARTGVSLTMYLPNGW